MTSREDHPAIQHLERLRGWRNRSQRARTLDDLPVKVARRFAKPHAKLGRLATAWQELIPEDLLGRTSLVGLSRGVLTVHVTDSATLYSLDRLLRSGLEGRLRALCPATLRRIRCVTAPLAQKRGDQDE